MSTDAFIKAARRAGRRQWILDLVSARWLRWLPEGVWDYCFDRFIHADAEARRLLQEQIIREGGVFLGQRTRLDYRGKGLS